MGAGLALQIKKKWPIVCGLAGGDWKTISDMIEEYIPDAIICKLED